jgi:hypothetical protein
MNRIRLLLFPMFAAAVMSLSGISLTYAEQGPATKIDPAAARKAEEKDPVAAKKKADAAVKARAQRDAAVKRRHDTKAYIKKVVEGQPPAAPDSGGEK